MPDTIQFFGGNQIINRYAADGRKLGTEYFTRITGLAAPLTAGQVISQSYLPGAVNQNGTAYVDNKEYNTLNGNWSLTALSRVHNPEGYASYNTSPYGGFIYTRKDHLGSIREVWHAASNSTIQRTQYYASGLAWETTPDDNLSTQPYKYNGKEFVEMHGYNGLDYGARTYFSDRSGWGSVDPLAEKYYSISPYAYCKGNPVMFVDPDGMRVETGSMTKDEQKEYDKMIASLNKSDLFKTMYSTLVNSKKVYNISFGKTDKDKSGNLVPGNFKPDSKTDGGSVTFLKGSILNNATTTEELAHAYQNENKTLKNPNINPEFEAKTITQLVGYDVAGYGDYNGMINFQRFLENDYHNVLTPKDVSSNKFQSSYQNAAILYSAYNQRNNIANPNYNILTLQKPSTLMRLINNTYLKNLP